MADAREPVDSAALEPGERARLRRVHDLLVAAGPPPELPRLGPSGRAAAAPSAAAGRTGVLARAAGRRHGGRHGPVRPARRGKKSGDGDTNRVMRTIHRVEEAQEVARWRREQLLSAGFEPHLAARLARDPRRDVHALLELVDSGCPPPLAARILAPLEEEA